MKQFILFLHKQRWLCALLLLPLGEAGRGFAQQYVPFPTDSAQWSVRHTINSPFSQNTIQYKMKGDTIVNGIPYHKIYYSLDLAYDSPNQTLHCFVREDTTKKVFVKYPPSTGVDTSEFMLYDFNLSVGDTVIVKLLYPSDSLFKLVVTYKDSIQTNIDFRKRYRLQPFGTIWGGMCDLASNWEWVQGKGSHINVFYNEIPQNSCGNYGGEEVSCFWHRGVYVLGGTFCDYTTGINEIKTNDNDLQIYPNPANSVITIDYKGEFKNTIIEIYNVTGQKIKSFNYVNSLQTININNFENGLYLLKINDGHNSFTQHFIKH